MSGFKLSRFTGIKPRLSESMIPEGGATVAENCDFAYGELRNTKGGFEFLTLSNVAASIYSDDGISFFSWDKDVNAVRSPLANDLFSRMYYSGEGGLRVANRLSAKPEGGPPASSYRVGVPRPTAAPTMTIPQSADISGLDLTWRFHYELNGVKFQEQEIDPAVVTEGSVWEYSPPTTTPTGTIQASAINKTYQRAIQSASGGFETVTDKVTLPDGTLITLLSANSVSYRDATGVDVTVSGVGSFFDGMGRYHETETVYTLKQYAFVRDEVAMAATPDGALPVFRLTGTNPDTGETVFDIYTASSSFNQGGVWTLVSAIKAADTTTFTLTLEFGIQEEDKETRAYVYTYVNTYNEEGPPSDPSSVTTSPVVGAVVKASKDTVRDYAPIKEIRIYRTPTGSSIASYFYVGSVSVLDLPDGEVSFTDDVDAALLNEEISSTYSYPPDLGLTGLLALPNGILAAWKGNALHFSDPYRPWSWPPAYVKTVPANIVGAIAHGAGAIVTTAASPYWVSGISPESMSLSRINVDQAGASKWSIAVVDGSVIYASHDGLVTINGATASLAQGQSFFTREVWRSRYASGLSTMRFAVWDGRLVVFSPSGAFVPFMIRFDEADGTMTDLPGFYAKCSFVSPLSDQFYYVDGRSLRQFQGGVGEVANWVSGECVIQRPCNYGAAQALVEGNWVVKLFAWLPDKETGEFKYQLKHTQQLTSGSRTFRLPSGFESDRYKLSISGKGRFRELRLAQTAKGLSEL